MDSNETHQQQQNRNAAAALAGPTAPSQAMHNRSSVGALSLLQPQPLQGVMLDGSPYSVSVATQRGRGRPRKYAPPDVNVIDGGGANAGPPAKRKGRPLGSRTKQPRKASGGGGGGPLTAHVINVNAGEDIAMKLVAFVNQEPRDVCILSVSGAVSSAVIQSHNPFGLVKLEGLYVITHMSGTFSNTESNGTVTRTGNLTVSLAGPDFMVVGGFVGGMLVAGSQVQVIVGTFEPERVKLRAALESADVLNSNGGGGPGLPQSQGPSESSEENASKSLGNSTPQPPHHLPLWPGNNPQ
ncbi:PREDICTED: AT-hook motif nuclear-localized protein 13-like isoform X1 [Brassica oleracea var. oleracea]|uniref:AT-hook motif nuclear-localized protein n=1 Tax=Brassica oleracea var. oleracea TaxID=109376 RepID=A0A0D3CBG1_BRAOL|nr:PREDICTED: AT-hook motif nuclear-localized protein 13-like isoform X1 [Brassica oleracea var. oleracea]